MYYQVNYFYKEADILLFDLSSLLHFDLLEFYKFTDFPVKII